jgi:DNA-directed RNA polymerase subunit RPC12/RpoP
MEQHLETTPDKLQCPHCGSENCFAESNYVEVTHKKVTSYMCTGCGYTSTTLNEADSEMIKEYEEVTPQLMLDLKWIDPATNLVWYPMVLNFPHLGIIFPDGTDIQNWAWRAAPAVDVPKEDAEKYPIPGRPGEFYTRRVDMESSQLFQKEDFASACKFIGLIQ